MSSRKIEPDNESQHVPGHVRSLLVKLAYGWVPEPMMLDSVDRLSFNNIDFSELEPRIHIEHDRLIAILGGKGFGKRAQELMPFHMNGELSGALKDNATFRGSFVVRATHRSDLTIEMASWIALRGSAPRLWIGQVEGATKISFGGNMIVERIDADGLRLGRKRHFRLCGGAYIYYLVQSVNDGGVNWHLVIDTQAGPPEQDVLDREFLLLQFVLGRQLRIPELLGVTLKGEAIATVNGSGSRRNLSPHSEAPVPMDRNDHGYIDESWASAFFDSVSAAWLVANPRRRSAYIMAFDSYLDSMSFHVDADYLRLQVALEAFAYRMPQSSGQGERTTVKDKAAWKGWVEEHADQIKEFAIAGLENSLYGKVVTAYRLASRRVVPSAYTEHGLILTTQMLSELERRDNIVHQGFMTPEESHTESELERVALVRTMLVALIARTVGYAGAINGWTVGTMGYPNEPPNDWWGIHEDEQRRAFVTFAIYETIS